MIIRIKNQNRCAFDLYSEIAEQLGYNTEECDFDRRKITIAANIAENFVKNYRELQSKLVKNNQPTLIIRDLIRNIPNIDETLNDNEAEIFDGFIALKS